jgi:antitoxin PrlF
MATRVTVKGQVTLPKAVRDAAGIKPGDSVTLRNVAGGGVLIERQADQISIEDYRHRLQEVARRQPYRAELFGETTSDEIMRLLRGDE